MIEQNRILLVGRQRDYLDSVSRLLESVGFLVTGTLSDAVAIDLVGSSDYGALLIGDEVPQSDGRYITREARNRKPSLPVIVVYAPESVLTQLKQAGIRV